MKNVVAHIIIVFFLFTSCERNYTEYTVIDTIPVTGNISNLYNSLKESTISSMIDCSTKTILDLPDGSQVEIPAFSFLDQEGNVFYGMADVMVLLAMRPGEFIIQNMTSHSDLGPLKVSKSIYVSAKNGAKKLKFRDNQSILIRLAQIKMRENQSVFRFDYNSDLPSWTEMTDTKIKEYKWISQGNPKYGISFEIQSFDWHGAHNPATQIIQAATICFKVPPQYVQQNTDVLAMSDKNILIPLLWDAERTGYCFDQYDLNKHFKFVLLSNQGSGNYYSSLKSVDPTSLKEIVIDPDPTTKAEIESLLNSL